MRKSLVLLALFSMLLVGCSQSPQPSTKPSTGLPVYENAEIYTAPTIYSQMIGIPSEGVTVKAYHVKNAKVKEILEWYKEKLSDYEIVQDITTATMSTPQGTVEYGILILKKGDEGIGVWAVSGEGEVVYFLATGPVDKFGSEGYSEHTEGQLPSSDVASGEEPIERYPGSVMLSYFTSTVGTTSGVQITYGASDDPQTVYNWYVAKLKSWGWNVEITGSENGEYTVIATKNGETLTITISPLEEVYTEINLNYASSS